MSAALLRARLLQTLFPGGVPPLWCPLLTHYSAEGAIDGARIKAHLSHLAPDLNGLLVPGSTGDGWELNTAEEKRLLRLILPEARRLRMRVLVGALKREHAETCQRVCAWFSDLGTDLQGGDVEQIAERLATTGVCGLTVCAPSGADLSQAEIQNALETLLAVGLPLALYQLPQVTQNEMSPELVADLAQRFPNFVLFKDSSGTDRVAQAGRDFGGVFLVRGAEGEYSRWLKTAGGPYHGFLLSTANCFARPLREIIEGLAAGRGQEAQALSNRISSAAKEAFRLVANVPDGNPFANANKALDHFFAYGPKAARMLPPLLHSGRRLPAEILVSVGKALADHQLLPARGYLE
jgi:dihydrodipicolinate synthase/N-acetylneuraminate lyase